MLGVVDTVVARDIVRDLVISSEVDDRDGVAELEVVALVPVMEAHRAGLLWMV
jgi:hypothetical protein